MSPRTNTPFEDLNYSREFIAWAAKNEITPSLLNQKTGWSYQYCWSLLQGRQPFGFRSFGLIVCAFGIEALEQIIGMAPQKLEYLRS